jgi:hypothetical protein
MKEEDLIKKLENAELPSIGTPGHQRRLKMALLSAGYPQRRQGFALPVFTTIIKGGIGIIMKGLLAKQQVWKTATVAMVAVALILGLSLAMPFTTDSACAQAEEITMNSASVKEALGGGEIEVVRIDIGDVVGTGKVILKGEAGSSILAEVDLKANKVTKMAAVTADDQIAIEIAKADPKVRELLDSGATIGEVSTMYVCGAIGNVATGETEDFSETLVMVEINGTEDSHVAYINLAEGKVDRLLKSVPMDPPSGTISFSIPDVDMEAQ